MTTYSSADLALAEQLGTSTLFEASGITNSALCSNITPVWPNAHVCGPAYPVSCAPGDNLGIHLALEHAPAGSVLVVTTNNFIAGYWGEVLTVAAQSKQIKGLIIDGGARDIAALARHQFPVFSRGVSVRGTLKDSVISVGECIQMTGTPVKQGDLVIADSDGVVILPQESVGNILQLAQQREQKETSMMHKLSEGETTVDLLGLRQHAVQDPTETQATFAPRINPHLQQAQASQTYGILDAIAQKRSRGETVISLCAGEPDFDTPSVANEAAIKAIQSGQTKYSPVGGLKALREAIAEKFSQENNIATSWENTLVCTGGKQAIFNALSATLTPASTSQNTGTNPEEVIIPAPYWVSYPEMVSVCGAKPVVVSCDVDAGFKLTAQKLKSAITHNTRWLILNSPSNPTGAVYNKDELSQLADILRQYPQVMVLSDDIYEHLIYDDLPFYTLAQIAPDLRSRIITVNGASKAYAMTGWRIGFATGPSWLIQAMIKLQGQQTSGACSIAQHAALAALTQGQDFVATNKAVFQHRRNVLVEGINAIDGLSCDTPQGAFYVFAHCHDWLNKTTPKGTVLTSDSDVAQTLLDEMNLAVVPGSAFGLSSYLRIAYAVDEKTLVQGCEKLQAFSQSLTPKS